MFIYCTGRLVSKDGYGLQAAPVSGYILSLFSSVFQQRVIINTSTPDNMNFKLIKESQMRDFEAHKTFPLNTFHMYSPYYM